MKHYAVILAVLLLSLTSPAMARDIDGGAVLGGVLGGAVGTAIGFAVGGCDGAILGGVIGAGVGAAIGSDSRPHYRPRRVPVYDDYHPNHYRYVDDGPPWGHAYGHYKHRHYYEYDDD